MKDRKIYDAVIQSIRDEQTLFDMREFWNTDDMLSSNAPEGYCGTASCIAGHAVHVSDDFEVKPTGEFSFEVVDPDNQKSCVERAGMIILGIDWRVAQALFFGEDLNRDASGGGRRDVYLSTITREQAIAALENVYKYDDPKWAKVVDAEQVFDG